MLFQMAKHAWRGYEQFAWGQNELKPISRVGHSASIFGSSSMGATIVDSLDTLYIMGLTDEFKKARDWVAANLNFNSVRLPIELLVSSTAALLLEVTSATGGDFGHLHMCSLTLHFFCTRWSFVVEKTPQSLVAYVFYRRIYLPVCVLPDTIAVTVSTCMCVV